MCCDKCYDRGRLQEAALRRKWTVSPGRPEKVLQVRCRTQVSLKEEIRIHVLDRESFQAEGTACAEDLKLEAQLNLGNSQHKKGNDGK